MSITFTIPGQPFAKQRHRTTRQGSTYTPRETVNHERMIGQIAAPLFAKPLQGPVRLTVLATFKPAKSWTKKKAAAVLGRHHTQKPDTDNLLKAVKDGLNGIAYHDDSQVAEDLTRKVWGPEARTVVTVEALEWGAAE